jgi:hypothetical protein
LGTRTSSKLRLAVEEARIPSFSSFFPTEKPGASQGTMKALMPGGEREGGREGGGGGGGGGGAGGGGGRGGVGQGHKRDRET